MKSKISIIIFLIIIITATFAEKLTMEQWLKDIYYLKEKYLELHPQLLNETFRNNFITRVENFNKHLDNKSDVEIYLGLKEVVASLNDIHCDIVGNDKINVSEKFFPVYFKNFGIDYNVIFIDEKYEELRGAKLLKINGYDIHEIEKRLSDMTPKENYQSVYVFTEENISKYEILKYKKIVDNENAGFTFEKNGKVYDITLKALDSDSVMKIFDAKINFPLPYTNRDKLSWWTYLKDENTVYFNIRGVKYFWEYCDNVYDVFEFIKNNKVDKLIIDLRNNPGGKELNVNFWKYFCTDSYINKKEHFFIITGKESCSAAVTFAAKGINETNAIIIGEVPMNKPNFYYGGLEFTLPESNLKFEVSCIFNKSFDEEKDGLPLDIIVSEKAEDFFNGEDTILNYIFEHY